MSERHPGEEHGGFDREIAARTIVGLLVGLAVISLIAYLTVGAFFAHLQARQARIDPPPSPVAAANAPPPPPLPRIEGLPGVELDALRAEEEAILRSYGWVDGEQAVARIPVERAIDIVLESGLPAAAPAPAAPIEEEEAAP